MSTRTPSCVITRFLAYADVQQAKRLVHQTLRGERKHWVEVDRMLEVIAMMCMHRLVGVIVV